MSNDLILWIREMSRNTIWHVLNPPLQLWYQEQWLGMTFYHKQASRYELLYHIRRHPSGVLDGYEVTEMDYSGWEDYHA